MIHDTIPLRYGGSAPTRLLKRAFFEASARLSTGIVTVSRYAKESIVADLGVTPDKINVVTYPRDEQLAARVRELRARLEPRDVALYVGSFAPHKNLERLIDAFGQTAFARNGGRLHLVGEASPRADALRARGGHETIVEGPWVANPDLGQVDEIGWTELAPGGNTPASSRVDWIEVYGRRVARP